MHNKFLYICSLIIEMEGKKDTLDYWIRVTWGAIQRMYNEEAKVYGTSMVSGFTLLSIDPKKGTPSTQLGPKMGLEPTSLSRTLNLLEEKGHIERLPNPEDGRGVLIHLTDSGLQMRDVSKKIVMNFNQKIENKISATKLATFFEVIEDIYKIVSEEKNSRIL